MMTNSTNNNKNSALTSFRQRLGKIESEFLENNQRFQQQTLLDVTTLMLKMKLDQIKQLKTDIFNYNSPHFTNEYRILEGQCSKLQSDLDVLDLSGREDLRKERKDALMFVGELAEKLGKKGHADGRSCGECEI
ncbi:unnamed protein product [Orchesella dallaii]|uniref:BAG domain-containing protein n=1 Tax=Orchesella dallaii TaxID=48710 RepID=A0ABP1Q9H4_9HEXA